MGVYVKDVTAPKNCTGCIAVHYYVSMVGDAGMLCEVTGLSMDDYYSGGRPDWCPLIEVPEPHGRLIDADKLKADNPRHMSADVPYVTEITVEEIIDEAPTIIPATAEGET